MKPRRLACGAFADLLDVDVVVDVIHAVAVVAVALRAVAEFEVRIVGVGSAADGAFVAIRALAGFRLVALCPVGVGLGARSVGTGVVLLRAAIAPGVGEEVLNIGAEEQEVIRKRNKRHEPVERQRAGQEQENNVHRREGKVHPGQILDFDGDEHHQKHSCLGREGCNSEEQAEVQVSRIDIVAEKQTCQITQQNAREIVEVKAANAPVAFQHLTELVVAEQADDRQKQIVARDIEQVRKDVGKKPPDLPLQDFGRGEAEKTVDHAARVDDRQRIGNQVSDGDDEHQVRNAAIAVFQTEAFEVFAEIFHMSTYLPAQAAACAVSLSFILPEMGKEVYRQSMNNVQVLHDMDQYGQNQRKTHALQLTF